jgi:nucleoside-diphosphate-sugar epimerase
MKRVLVTGATGFVGRPLCRLLLAKGWQVRAAVREHSSALAVLPSAVEAHAVGDLDAEPDWSVALAGAQVVVHLAGRVPAPGAEPSEQAYQRTNTAATIRLARAAVRAGTRRLVFVSSVKVLGESSPRRPLRGDDSPQPADAYARSKLAAECALAEILANTTTELVIVRAPIVYGPGAGGNFLRLTEAVLSDRWLPLGALKARRSMVCVDGLCDLLERALEHPQAEGAPLLVADPEDLTVAELVQRLGALLGHRPRLFPVPPALLKLAGILSGRSGEIRRLSEPLQVDLGDTQRRLDWRPMDPSACLAATVSWLRRGRSFGDDP